MSEVIRTNQTVGTDRMEPLVAGGYTTRGYDTNLYACGGCGLTWTRQWHAQTCEKRGHVTSFPQHYGGMVVNDEYKPARTFIREAYGRIKV